MRTWQKVEEKSGEREGADKNKQLNKNNKK